MTTNSDEEIIEEILGKSWQEYKTTPNFQTYDIEGINNLVRIAIKKALAMKDGEKEKEFKGLAENFDYKFGNEVRDSMKENQRTDEILKMIEKMKREEIGDADTLNMIEKKIIALSEGEK